MKQQILNRLIPLWRIAMASTLLALSGCLGLPPSPPSSPTYTLAVSVDAPLSKVVEDSRAVEGSSGFRLLPSGPDALQARLELARMATQSLDLQYFIFQSDSTGREMMRALRDAAARGVRVRLLIDDLYTQGQDELLACLAAHERVEVRLFNPFALRAGGVFARFAASPFFFGRLNHRMHNKLFVADAAWAITGGRNIGDEYFTRNDAGNFIDLDVLAAGKVVGDMSRQFDLYWNSAATVPIEYVAARSAPASALRDRFETLTRSASAPALALAGADVPDALGRSPVATEFAAGRVHLAWGDGESYADLPGKALSASQTEGRQEHGSNLVRLNALEHIRAASGEILLTSPYFIPGRAGVDLLAEAARRGVKVSVLTNSLASTDQPLVHGAYRRYRPALLTAGVALFELSPLRAGREEQRKLFGLSVGGLHTKSLVIDRKELFVGSMNFDPRSDRINTESALAIHVAEVAEDAARLAALSKMQAAHQLRLSEGQALEWISPAGGEGPIHADEPESEIWQKIWLQLTSEFAPEGLL
ncbi:MULTISPECIES: phospholipase D family protein [Variovorax]|jgi:putative cardiolipin synthase|uniref:phospholipase D family protein n=1 Tax=Variovorax TaxID=34072 RepID=UPI0007D920C7|nr:phospholipase D family protein [Variovorax boronicumulans]GER21385.1 phospholipase D family protein [Variovorax boronicumulans]